MRMQMWVVAVAGLLALVFAAGCSRTPPEEALRERMELLQRHIDERDASGIGSLLADDFIGSDGMDQREARRMAAALFMRYRSVGVQLGPLQIVMRGDTHATVRFTAAASGGSGGLLPDDAQIYDVSSGWRLDDGEWRMTSAEWVAKM